jgi:hypothetical protein
MVDAVKFAAAVTRAGGRDSAPAFRDGYYELENRPLPNSEYKTTRSERHCPV